MALERVLHDVSPVSLRDRSRAIRAPGVHHKQISDPLGQALQARSEVRLLVVGQDHSRDRHLIGHRYAVAIRGAARATMSWYMASTADVMASAENRLSAN